MPVVPMNEFKTAMKSIRKARNLFMLIILLALLVQIGSFLAIDVAKITESKPVATTCPASQPACEKSACPIPPKTWRFVMNWMLPLSKQAAFFASIMLVVILGIGSHFSMLGPSGRGIHHMISAFLWSIVLVLILTPWQQVMPGSIICGATYSLGDIINMQADKANKIMGYLPYYARFVAYPALALFIWLAVAVKFRKACKKLTATNHADVKAANMDDIE